MASANLYRFYASGDVLLYVGISYNAWARASGHAKDKSWWRDVARSTIEQWFE